MDCIPKKRHVVLVASPEQAAPLARVFNHPGLSDWGLTVAASPEHARFLTKLLACDVVLLDESALGAPGDCTVRWLSSRGRWPVLFVSSPSTEGIQQALSEGAKLWLPRDLVKSEPALLAEGLLHALRGTATRRRVRRAVRHTRLHRGQVRRLADLMWTSLPVESRPAWLSQRYMLERLSEEVMRSERHSTPLTLVLGEWKVDLEHDLDVPLARPLPGLDAERSVRDWTVERVLESKRRSDVAGQYGLRGFMLLLPHTQDKGATEFCRRLRTDLGERPPGLPRFWRLHTSLGSAGFSEEFRTTKSLLRLAEERLEDDVGVTPPGDSSGPSAHTA